MDFSCFAGGPKAHEQLSWKVFGGIGILPVRVHRLKTCATNGGGHGGPPHQPLHALRRRQSPMDDCPVLTRKICFFLAFKSWT